MSRLYNDLDDALRCLHWAAENLFSALEPALEALTQVQLDQLSSCADLVEEAIDQLAPLVVESLN